MSSRAKSKVGARICTQFVNHLKESQFYKMDFLPPFTQCLQQLGNRRISKIVCYGLGSFNSGVNVAPRYQLALLLLIYDKIVELTGSEYLSDTIDIYDPKFNDRDLKVLQSFLRPKFCIIKENEMCARRLEVTTLVFMPHLYKRLYHNLLGANWHPENLKRLILIGNSFREMIDCTIMSKVNSLYYIDLLVNNFSIKNRKPSRKRRPELPIPDEDSDKHGYMALIELSMDTADEDLRFSFSNQSVHFIDDQWLGYNKDKIEMYRLKDWHPDESPTDD